MLKWNLIPVHSTLNIVWNKISSSMYQYYECIPNDKEQYKVTVQALGQKICATLIVVDVKNQIPLFGRDWMVSFRLDFPTILNHT